MKYKINTGANELYLFIHLGIEGEESFLSEVDYMKTEGGHDIVLKENAFNNCNGLHVFNHIWIRDWDLRTLLHEVQHYLDILFDALAINNEVEAKAIFMSNLIEKVLNLRDSEGNK